MTSTPTRQAETRCGVLGCPHRLRAFTLAWPWHCPDHGGERALDSLERRLLNERSAGTRRKGWR